MGERWIGRERKNNGSCTERFVWGTFSDRRDFPFLFLRFFFITFIFDVMYAGMNVSMHLVHTTSYLRRTSSLRVLICWDLSVSRTPVNPWLLGVETWPRPDTWRKNWRHMDFFRFQKPTHESEFMYLLHIHKLTQVKGVGLSSTDCSETGHRWCSEATHTDNDIDFFFHYTTARVVHVQSLLLPLTIPGTKFSTRLPSSTLRYLISVPLFLCHPSVWLSSVSVFLKRSLVSISDTSLW